MLYIHHNSGNFEWTATMLNINKGHNRDIMNKCQALSEYSDFVSKVKEYSHTMPIKEAIDLAVGYAISHNYLDGFFKKHKEGIMLSCLTEFNEEVFRKGIHEEGYAEGHAEGQSTERLATIQKLHAKGKSVDEIMELLDFSREEVMAAINTSD